MKGDTAERLAERALRVSDELNQMALDVEANEPEDESIRLRQAIGRVMWAVYYEILMPTFEEHPPLEPDSGAGALTKISPAPRKTRSALQPVRRSAPRSARRRKLREP